MILIEFWRRWSRRWLLLLYRLRRQSASEYVITENTQGHCHRCREEQSQAAGGWKWISLESRQEHPEIRYEAIKDKAKKQPTCYSKLGLSASHFGPVDEAPRVSVSACLQRVQRYQIRSEETTQLCGTPILPRSSHTLVRLARLHSHQLTRARTSVCACVRARAISQRPTAKKSPSKQSARCA